MAKAGSKGRASQKRSKAVAPKRGLGATARGLGLTGRGLGLTGRDFASAALSGAAGLAGGLAGSLAGLGLKGTVFGFAMVAAPADGAETGAPAAGVSCPAAGGIGFAAGGDGRAGPDSGGSVPALFAPAKLKAGAVRAFLRARYPGAKPQFAIAAETGVPADTIRKAIAVSGPSELSGPHLMRLVAVYGPAFVAAVMEPCPAWAQAFAADP